MHARASYQKIDNIRLGGNVQSPSRIASQSEVVKIDNAIALLNKAKAATNQSSFRYSLSEAFRVVRSTIQAHQQG